MRKAVLCWLVFIFFVLSSLPAFAILRSTRIAQVGLSTKTESSDMGEVEDALDRFAAMHPEATVSAFQMVYHPLSGSYDIFIFYNE